VRGDVAPASDPPVPVQALLGVVTRVERGHRRVGLGLGPERVLLAWLSHRGLLRTAAQWRLRIRGALLGSRISANIAHAELSIRARVAG
jgi:hypothetical protein